EGDGSVSHGSAVRFGALHRDQRGKVHPTGVGSPAWRVGAPPRARAPLTSLAANRTTPRRPTTPERSAMPHSAVMHLGLAIFATDESIAPGELARWAEELGFESLLFPEHTHIP